MLSPSKFQGHSAQKYKINIVKYIWKHKRPQIAKAILSKKIQCWRDHNSDLKLYYRSIAIKTTWYWHKNRKEEQWSRIENPYAINEGAQNTQWRKGSLFNKSCWENWISTCRRLKLVPCLSPCTKINSKWIKDLNIRPETLK
jgi:hypothetical protein